MEGPPRHSVKWRKHDRNETCNTGLFIQEYSVKAHMCRCMDNSPEDHINSGRGAGMMEEIEKDKVK